MRGLNVFPACNHRLEQMFLLDQRVERNGTEVKRNQGNQDIDRQFVDAGQDVTEFLACNHRLEQMFLLDQRVERNGTEVKRNQGNQDIDRQFVDAGQDVTEFL